MQSCPCRKKLLAIDDEELVLEVLSQVIKNKGGQGISAIGGEAALKVVQSTETIDVAILDMTMPGMSGKQVYQDIRSHRPDLPVVFCTGQNPEDCRPMLQADPKTAFLAKPYTPEQLIHSIKEAQRHSPGLQTNEGYTIPGGSLRAP